MNIWETINKINDTIALNITQMVGTMWCVYLFSIMVAIPLFYPESTTVIMFISSSFMQLVLLPILLVGQQLLSRATDRQREQDHKRLHAALKHIHTLIDEDKKDDAAMAELRAALSAQQTILEDIQKRLPAV